ncbi:MAG TPA: TolC family protein [Gemmataceae bacterium]|nr:TolC family protein [Gemmataceae bacterium]
MTHPNNHSSTREARCVLLFLLLCAAGIGGCTRAFYRNSADKEVYDIINEKDKYDAWKVDMFHIYPDPRSRFGDPTNPDRPLMPPDDEAAWNLSPHPQKPGHRGTEFVRGTAYLEMVKAWDAQNRAEVTATANRKRPIKTLFDEPLAAEYSGFLLSMDQAIELGVINSPTYQSIRESLYLTALPVTQQRFNFAYQWAATADWIRQWAGPTSNAGLQNRWLGTSNIGFSKLFSTGALLTTDFTNTTVFNFVGNGFTSASTVNVNVVQPFLQGGGKAVNLEPLTQTERNLLYAMRAYYRFREQFNVAVALGTTPPTDLRSAFASTTAGPISTLAALGIASTDVSGGFVGYLSVLYRQLDMAVDQKLVADLERAVKIIEAYQEGGMFSPLQVDQVRSTLYNAKNTVLSDRQFVTNGLDQFKIVLGLPANTPLILDDSLGRPVTDQLDKYYAVIDAANDVQILLEKQQDVPPEKLRGTLGQIFTKDELVVGTKFASRILDTWRNWANLNEPQLKKRMSKVSAERRELLDQKTDLELKKEVFPPESAARLAEAEYDLDVGNLEVLMRRYESKPWEKLIKKDVATVEQIKLFRLVASASKTVLVWARNERFDIVRKAWPDIPPAMLGDLDLLTADVQLAQEKAVQAALTSRLDLMNARAQLVDAWRQLRVTANSLLGVLNVQYNLTSQTPPDGVRPLVFSSNSTNQQLALNFQLPLNRIAQRNTYRTALINYQAARRSLMVLEDNVAVQVRFDVRQLQLFAANYKIQQQLVHLFYSQVENALEVIVAPADPDQLKQSSTNGAANSAALTNQYLQALNGLNGAQAKMYDIWLSLYATRMQLYLDLERLTMDGRGVWTDELLAPRAPGSPEPQPLELLPAPRPLNGAIQPMNAVPAPQPINGAAPPGPRPVFLTPQVVSDRRAVER